MTTPITILVSEDSRDAAVALGRELASCWPSSRVAPASRQCWLGALARRQCRPRCSRLPRLVDLPPNGAAVRRLRQVEGDLIVLSRLYPRAAYWLLRAHGIDGRFCHAGGLSQFSSDENRDCPLRRHGSRPIEPPRSIHCLDLRCFPDAAAIAHSIFIHGAEIARRRRKSNLRGRLRMRRPACRDGIR